MPGSGRKNRLGSLHGPCGNEWLNGCAPAMLAGLRGANCDVQVPYRLPYACDICGTRLEPEARRAIALAAQRAQDAQTGYCADYCSKNQPMGFAEIKEFQKGHDHLHAQVRGSSVDCIGKRHASRFLSDAYLKGVVRGQVECCNLRAHHRDATVVSAERISTTAFESFPGGAFVDVVQHLHAIDPSAPSSKVSTRWTRRHSSGVRHLAYVNVAEVYGHRPALSEIWWLSPYEFVASWRVTLACVPATKREWETLDETGWDVTITAAGRRHIQKQNDPDKKLNLQPGAHYTLRLDASNNRILLDRTTATETLRHRCYLQRRTRPCCPHFENSPVPQHTVDQAEPNARLTLTYFRAWTLNARNASATVPFAGHLKGSQQTWLQALQAWLTRLPCEETKRYVGNFLSVYRVRPVDTDAANSDDEAADEPLLVTAAALPTVLTTSFRQTGKQNQTKAASKADAAALASYKAAVAQADVIWQPPARAVADNMPNPYESIDPREVQTMLKTAKANRKAKAPSYEHASETAAGTWQAQAHCVSKEVDEFLVDIRQQHKCNTEQLQFLQTVCERIRAEALTGQDRGGAAETNTEPLRWALHGGPGTGKSYVLNLLRQDLFQQRLNWQQGKEFQVVAFQAVNAEPLDGDTIHAALGLAWHGNDSSVDAQRILDLASSAVQWRWLLLDEISMVSAEMLARLEARCRQLVLDLSATKYGKHSDGRIAPFGGLNVVLSGDLWQLPPPRGTFLGQIPWQLLTQVNSKKLPLTLQGQQLVWASAADGGLQGVTELTRCERTQDKWLQELQAELRIGGLSKDNHAFLHGQPTQVPGSWLISEQRATCGKSVCQQLCHPSVTPRQILQRECASCRAERASKRLVATGLDDPRFANELARAQAIFSTNVVKCHVNRIRAEQWARLQGQRLYYAVAQDVASSQTLHTKPDLQEEKLTWLRRSDADCGDRCGVLPLRRHARASARAHSPGRL